MKKLAILLLVAFCLWGCANSPSEGKEPVSAYHSTGEYIDLGNDRMTLESLSKLPVKHSAMTTDEAREAVVAFCL